MNSERQPLDLNKILLPNRRYVIQTTRRQWSTPRLRSVGKAMLEFLAAKLRFKKPRSRPLSIADANQRAEAIHPGLSLSHALRVKSAEYWLLLGEPFEALAELQMLPDPVKRDPWVVKVMVYAAGALRERGK